MCILMYNMNTYICIHTPTHIHTATYIKSTCDQYIYLNNCGAVMQLMNCYYLGFPYKNAQNCRYYNVGGEKKHNFAIAVFTEHNKCK